MFPITLSGLDSAHLSAEEAFHNTTHYRFPREFELIYMPKSVAKTLDESETVVQEKLHDGTVRYMQLCYGYKTKENYLDFMKVYQLANMRFIYRWLLETYPQTDYAERYAVSNSWGCNSYWAQQFDITYEQITDLNADI